MRRNHVSFILGLTFISLPSVKSECRWPWAVWSEGSCFLYESKPLNYSDATAACQTIVGVLARIKSRTQLLAATVGAPTGFGLWIGARYEAGKRDWVWEDDDSLATELSQFWADAPQTQGCAEIDVVSATEREAYAAGCSHVYPFLCMEKGFHKSDHHSRYDSDDFHTEKSDDFYRQTSDDYCRLYGIQHTSDYHHRQHDYQNYRQTDLIFHSRYKSSYNNFDEVWRKF